ncbi:MAG: DUF1178 family protein [Planctomycetes bacterium]|nr:DUF1178 family protein [Planctomycetota bacterium]
MAIQFHCVSCEKAIEVADEWACRLVECPYCGDTITAPGLSHPAMQAGSSTPATDSFAAPSDDVSIYGDRSDEMLGGEATLHEGQPQARKSFDWLALTALALGVVAFAIFLVFAFGLFGELVERIGTEPTPEEIQKVITDAIANDEMWVMKLSLQIVAALGVWLVSFVLAVVAFIRNQRNPRGKLASWVLVLTSLPWLFVVLSLACQ